MRTGFAIAWAIASRDPIGDDYGCPAPPPRTKNMLKQFHNAPMWIYSIFYVITVTSFTYINNMLLLDGSQVYFLHL